MRIEVGGERSVKSEEWKVSRGQWAEVSEQGSVNINHWSLNIDIGMRFFACVVGAKSASWRSGVCDAIRPYAVACVFASNRPHCNSPTLQFPHVFNCPHLEGLIAISPYTCVFWTFANIHVNTQKTSWAWYGFVCVCRRGDLQIAHTESFVSRL